MIEYLVPAVVAVVFVCTFELCAAVGRFGFGNSCAWVMGTVLQKGRELGVISVPPGATRPLRRKILKDLKDL
jgi:hypothetical protein